MFLSYLRTFQHYPSIIAFGFLASFFSSFGQTFFIGLYGNAFRETFDLSHTDFGSIYSSITLVGGFTLLFFGHFIDKIRISLYASIVVLGLGIGCFIIYSTQHLPLFILGLLMVRFLGQGMMSHMSSTVTARHVVEGRGHGLTMTSIGQPVGDIVFPLIVTALLTWLSWRETWLLYSVICLIVVWPTLFFLSKGTLHTDSNNTIDAVLEDKNISQVLRDYTFWVIILISTIMPFLLTGIFFHQQWLTQDLGLPPHIFAYSLTLFGAGHVIFNIFAGHFSDLWGSTIILKYFLIPFIIATLLLIAFPTPLTFIIFMASASFTSFTIPARGSFLAERYGTSHLGAIKSLVFGAIVFSSALSPVLFGAIIDLTHQATAIFHLSWIFAVIVTFSAPRLKK